MRRCQAEIDDRNTDKKLAESALVPFVAAAPTTFDELLARHSASWRTMTEPDSMRCVASRARRMLNDGDFDRLVLWVILERGVGFARAAGLLHWTARAERAV